MSVASHLDELRRRHQSVDRAVKEAQTSPAASDTEIAQLKRRKLHLKDAIFRIEQGFNA